MTLDELKAEVRDASPEVREELFTLLAVLRRARDPERARVPGIEASAALVFSRAGDNLRA